MASIMSKRGQKDNIVTYEHICDTIADLANIPLEQATLGSVAIVLKGKFNNFEVYIAKSGGIWIPILTGTGGSGEGGGIDTSNDTVTSAVMLQGYTAHDRDGIEIIGEIITRTIEDLQKIDSTIVIPAGYYAEAVEYEIETSSNNELPIAQENDVIFIDYDGTIRYSYTKEEFLALTELPPNPTHQGLIAQGWNWSLSNAKSVLNNRNALVIGQHYITDDGKTRIYIKVPEDNLTIMFDGCCATNQDQTKINFGDSEDYYYSSWSNNRFIEHTYATKGNYVITIEVLNNGYAKISGSPFSNLIYGKNSAYTYYYYYSLVYKVQLGSNITLGSKAFREYNNLKTISMPLTCFEMVLLDNTFDHCTSLQACVIPPTVQNVGTRGFYYASNLKYVAFSNTFLQDVAAEVFQECTNLQGKYIYLNTGRIPLDCFKNNTFQFFEIAQNVKYIGGQSFYQSYRLKALTIPKDVYYIDAGAFQYALSLKELHFKSTTPPTIAASDNFYQLPLDCKIYVPQNTLSQYTSATNYPSSTSYTYVEE